VETPKQHGLSRLGNACGMLAPVLWAAAIVYCGSLRPEFSHYRQYISELGERAGSTELLMRYAGFVPTGVMHVAFAMFLFSVFRCNRLAAWAALLIAVNGVARVAAGMFPCEVGCTAPHVLLIQQLHSLAATIGFFAFIGAVLLWGIALKRYPGLRDLRAYSFASAALALVFLLLMSWSDATRAGTGLYERLSSGVLSLWLLVFAARLWRLDAARRNPQRE
jgi:hypothetical membrane protein